MPQSQNASGFGAAEITVRVLDPKQEAQSVSQFEGLRAGQRLDSSFEAPRCSVASLIRSQI